MACDCDVCGGEFLRFQPPPGVRGVDRTLLPSICRRCGRVFVDGKVVPLSFEASAKIGQVANEAHRHGKEARAKLLSDPDARIEKYFDQVYRAAFVHGFTRAAAYFSQFPKEGRLRRLRAIWDRARTSYSSLEAVVRMDLEAFQEFCQLLLMPTAARWADA